MTPEYYMELRTEKGIKFFFFGLILFIIWQIFSVVFALAITPVLEDLPTDQTSADPADYEGIIVYALPACGILILLLIVLIFIFLGLINLVTGRAEFGEAHTKNTEIGITLLAVGFFSSLIGGIIAAFIVSESTLVAAAGFIAAITSAFCYGFGFLYLLKQLLDEQGMKYLKLGVVLIIIINIINVGLTATVVFIDNNLFGSLDNFFYVSLAFSLFIILPWTIFTFSFYRAWKLVKWRVVKPVLPKLPTPGILPNGAPGQWQAEIPMSIPGKPDACPSCGYIIMTKGQKECPKCGFYFGKE